MNDIIQIRPVEGSRRVAKKITQEFYASVEHENSGGDAIMKEDFNDDRWDGTQQTAMPIYDYKLGRFRIIDPTDHEYKKELLENSEELNKLAARCKFKREFGPNKGEYINEIDIFDDDDDFMRHSDLYITHESGKGDYDSANPINKIMILHLMAEPDYQIGGKNSTTPIRVGVKYLIINPEIDKKVAKDTREKRYLAMKNITSLGTNKSKKLSLAMALNILDGYQDVKDVDLDSLLDEYAMDAKTELSPNKSKQDYFNELFDLGDDLLKASFIYTAGVKFGFIRYNSTIWQAFGENIGKDKDAAISYLMTDDGMLLIERLQQAIYTSNLVEDDYKNIVKNIFNVSEDLKTQTYAEVSAKELEITNAYEKNKKRNSDKVEE